MSTLMLGLVTVGVVGFVSYWIGTTIDRIWQPEDGEWAVLRVLWGFLTLAVVALAVMIAYLIGLMVQEAMP